MRQSHAVSAWAACLFGTLCLVEATFAAETQDDRVTVLEQKLDRSLKLIEQLTDRVKELEAQRAGTVAAAQTIQPATAAEPSQQTQQRLDRVQQQVTQLADANASRGGGGAGVPLHGFFDVGIGNHTANRPDLKGTN